MRTAILYSSKTGNTKYLAESLYDVIKAKDCILCETRNADKVDADFYFIGFWTCRGKCDNDTKHFIETLQNKDVFLFGTCGFGGSTVYFRKVLWQTQKYLNSSVRLVGGFMCQGRYPIQNRAKYEEMRHSVLNRIYANYMLKYYEKASGHPNEDDASRLLSEVRKILPQLENNRNMTD